MTRKLLTTALLASGAALLIAAGPKADLNQDGQVTKAEFMQTATDRFAAVDTDGDLFLSKDEQKAMHEGRHEKRADRQFDRLDANKDGNISRAEMDAMQDQRKARKDAHKSKVLEKFDTNLDGELSDAERTAMRAERDEMREDRKAKRGDRKARRAERPKPDANGDGLVSLDEHLAVSEQLFMRMDSNGDGVLVKGEGQMRKGRKGDHKKRGGQ
jgi:Ca2+-binding EF-hand superfamily protein